MSDIAIALPAPRPFERFDAAVVKKDGALTVEERAAARVKFAGDRRGRRGSI